MYQTVYVEERALVAAMLFQGRSMASDVIAYGLQSDDFDDSISRDIYAAIVAQVNTGEDISVGSVHLVLNGEARDAIWDLDDGGNYGPVGLRSLAKWMIERRHKRKLATGLRAAIETLDEPYNQTAVTDALAHAQKAIADSAPVAHESFASGLDDDCAMIENPKIEDSLITTGSQRWDDAIGPISQQLIVLAGRTSTGKSSLALNVVHANLRRHPDRICAVFSLEDSAQSVRRRLYAIEIGMSFDKAKKFSAADRRQYIEEMRAMRRYTKSLRIYDQLRDIDAICAAIQGLADSGRLGLVVVDYLQLCNPPKESRRESREQQVAQMSRRLQAAAHTCGAPVLALSQLNRECDKEDRRPRITDLRESGAIEQDADRIWLIYRPQKNADGCEQSAETDKPHVLWMQEKNKNGPKPSGWFQFDQTCFRFTKIDRPAA